MPLIRVGPLAWLVAYDIADPRRLGRVGRWVRAHAMPIQYSLYLGRLGESDLQALTAGLAERIKAAEDDVRLYHLPSLVQVDTIGRSLADPGLVEFAPVAEISPTGRGGPSLVNGIQWGAMNPPSAMTPVPLPISRFRAVFTAGADLRMPEYAGSAWRGAFGHALKRAVCVTRLPRCAGCTLRIACAYAGIFETPPPPGATAMRKYEAAPHPFVLVPADGSGEIAAGGTLQLGFVLVGRAMGQLPYVLHALGEAGRQGLTATRTALALETVFQETETGSWQPIFRPEMPAQPLAARVPACPPVPAAATLHLATPLRLKRDGRLVRPEAFRFADLAMNQLRRHSMLCMFQTEAPLEADFASLRTLAQRVPIREARLEWRDWTRYSSRQDTRMQMGGLVGELTIDLAQAHEFWPHLWLGSLIHAGHGTSMGLGRYAIGAASLP